MFINFSDIPGHRNLFLDFLYEFDNVDSYYHFNFRDEHKYEQKFAEIASFERPHRKKLASIIEKSYGNKNISAKTSENLQFLKENNCIAIITGQQVGIVGGPLYTFYKLITAVKLSEKLNKKYQNFNFVPIFWLATDDNDFEEINNINLWDKENNLVNIEYRSDVFTLGEEDRVFPSVGNIKIEETISEFFQDLETNLRKSDFTDSLFDILKKIYSPGKGFGESFAELMHAFFDMYGIVLFDPNNKDVKKILQPVFLHELNTFRANTAKLVSVSAELENVYHAQVKINPLNLFLHTESGRVALEPINDDTFRPKRKKVKISKENLQSIINEAPERISPNVVLRPICQDFLFPTGFYIGGPAEVAYFAQSLSIYENFGIPEPIIYPRSSATLVEKNTASLLTKLKISPADLMFKSDIVKNKILSSLMNIDIDGVFEQNKLELDEAFIKLQNFVVEIDKTLNDPTSKIKGKLLSDLDNLKNRVNTALARKHEITVNQIDKAIALIFPDGTLQEREINFIYFANKYGLDLIDYLYDEIQISKYEHQIIYL